MILTLQRFDINVIYKPGKELVIADTLSRDYLEHIPESESMPRTTEIFSVEQEFETVDPSVDLPIYKETIHLIKSATIKCETMQLLKHNILTGWSEDKKQVPAEIRAYFNERD